MPQITKTVVQGRPFYLTRQGDEEPPKWYFSHECGVEATVQRTVLPGRKHAHYYKVTVLDDGSDFVMTFAGNSLQLAVGTFVKHYDDLRLPLLNETALILTQGLNYGGGDEVVYTILNAQDVTITEMTQFLMDERGTEWAYLLPYFANAVS